MNPRHRLFLLCSCAASEVHAATRRLAAAPPPPGGRMGQTTCKPGSVPAEAGDGHSSGTPVTGRLARPTRTATRKPARRHTRAKRAAGMPSLLGLAPGGVYRAVPVAGNAVRSYRTLSPLPADARSRPAVCFLWHFPWGRPRRVLPGTVLPWSPDFPPPPATADTKAAIRPSGIIHASRRRADCKRSNAIYVARYRSSTVSSPRWTPTSAETLRIASSAPSTYGRALLPES